MFSRFEAWRVPGSVCPEQIVSVRKPSLSHRRLLPWPQHSVDLVASALNPQTSLRRSSLFAPQTHFDSPPSRISEPGDGLHVSSFGFPPAAMEENLSTHCVLARKVCHRHVSHSQSSTLPSKP